jgi:hypothetical protein
MENTITLTKSNTGWNATFSGPASKQIVSLFGTATIPTPFTASASQDTVLADVTARNPEYKVTVA